MPYIYLHERKKYINLVKDIRGIFGRSEVTPGDLDYIITNICLCYIEARGQNFGTYAEIAGVLDLVMRELYERKIKIYEQLKCKQNGDVF